MKFEVSVIIPVYNAEAFLEKAIKSALQQPEVLEVIVVNDGSTDGSLEIAEELKQKDSRVKIYHHKNYTNKGRSASRNLGIEKANANYIAFLDADDYYLENRFTEDKKVFEEYEEAEGVYNAIGVHFYRKAEAIEEKKLKLTMVSEKIDSEQLFNNLLYYKKGHFSIDGLTVKKKVFSITGCFDEDLEVSEDTHLILKMALRSQLVAGIIDKPVARRGVHHNNVFNKEHVYEKQKLKVYESLLFWASKNKVTHQQMDDVLNVLWIFRFRQSEGLVNDIKYWFYIFFKANKLFLTTLPVKYFPVVRLRKKLLPFLYK